MFERLVFGIALEVIFLTVLVVDPACAKQPVQILTQPQSQTINAGSSVTFSVTARGDSPLSYQWRFYGTPINGETHSSLSLSQAQCAAAGSYSVVVTNSVNSVTSSEASLTVIDTTPPVLICPTNVYGTICNIIFMRPTAIDNCDSSPIVSNLFFLEKVGTNGLADVYNNCWRAVDHSGNVADCCQTVTIIPYDGYVPPPVTDAVQSFSPQASIVQPVGPAITLLRGIPGLLAGQCNSSIGPQVSSNCGQLSSTNLWFEIFSHGSGYATIRAEGCNLLALYGGSLCSPTNLTRLACCADTNGQCQAQFPAVTNATYWLALDGVTNGGSLRLGFGFDPGIDLITLKSNQTVELQSSVAPPLIYNLLASADLNGGTSWTTLLTTNLGTNFPYLHFVDTNLPIFSRRFYRIVPGR